KEGDYSHFDKFNTRISEWQTKLPGSTHSQAGDMVPDIKKIMWESFTVQDSEVSLGLQAADIAVSIFRRALMGTLKFPTWTGLGKLMFKWSGEAVKFFLVRPKTAKAESRLTSKFAGQVMLFNSAAPPLV